MKTSVLRLVVSLAGALLASAQLSARIVNISTRGTIGSGDRGLVTGFVIAGDSPKTVLVRGVGPGLAAFGLTNVAASIKIELYDSTGALVARNDGYRVTPDLAALERTSVQVGAFPLSNAGDSALVATLPAGGYTVVGMAGGDAGAVRNALIEIYDADSSDSRSAIVNLSGRGMVGSGNEVLITGFVIAGDAPHSMLLRGIGRDLARYGVPNTAAAVDLSVYGSKGNRLASSRNLAPPAQTTETWADTVAFRLSDGGGSTAIVTLAPGAYTLMVDPSPANQDNNIGLLEVYDGGQVEAAVPVAGVGTD